MSPSFSDATGPASVEPTAGRPATPFLQLLHAAQRGDGRSPDALEALMTALYPVIRRFLVTRVQSWRDPHDIADDLVQETIVRCFLHVRACRAECDRTVAAWALTTARHTLIDLLRAPSTQLMAQQFARDFVEDMELTAGRARVGVVHGEPAFGCSFDEAMGHREAGAPARELLLRLAVEAYTEAADETGELLWWRLVMGAEWSEVAEHLHTTAAGAKRRFQRAQVSLERALHARIAALPTEVRGPVDRLVSRYLESDRASDLAPNAAGDGSSVDPAVEPARTSRSRVRPSTSSAVRRSA